MQRGLGGFPHSLLHQDGSREKGTKILTIHLGLVKLSAISLRASWWKGHQVWNGHLVWNWHLASFMLIFGRAGCPLYSYSFEDSAHLTQLLVGKNPLVLVTILDHRILPTLRNY
ncbi:hypothetical protein BJP36_18190 [Moorena producens JHB]|uniref:Uncharacterized protein n=1 Tax=Moorena producens (strain JHB) TaxID=1454205 RepID=A0A1D9G1Z4_MOOP1|nr:hypothetical protein [Moorena producens]AOY81554.1 hypothetical protein BJP36_18190 [Moorena producens JHB]